MKAFGPGLRAVAALALWGVSSCAQTSATFERSQYEARLARAEGEDRAYLIGMLRAEAVRESLVSLGVEPARIEVASRGWWLPSRGTSALAVNRSAKIVPLEGPQDLGRPVAAVYGPGGEAAVVGGAVYFTSGSWELSSEAQRTLQGQAEWLRAHPGVRIRIEGNADSEAG
jgi:outer membrane protein OmpA-like peptidoglycan-associated protein